MLGNLQELEKKKKSRPWFPYRSGGSILSFEEHSRDRGRLAALEVPGVSCGMLLRCGNDETVYVCHQIPRGTVQRGELDSGVIEQSHRLQ